MPVSKIRKLSGEATMKSVHTIPRFWQMRSGICCRHRISTGASLGQRRRVERQADGISSGLVLGAAPAALADNGLVLYARDESTGMPVTVRLNPRIMVPAGSLRLWTGRKKRRHAVARWACPPGWHRGVYSHRLHLWVVQSATTRFAETWALNGEIISQPDGVSPCVAP